MGIICGGDKLNGGTATASSKYAGDANYAASWACDNDIATFWLSDSAQAFPAWWKYDLGGGISSAYKCLTIMATLYGTGYGCKDFTLQGSLNNTDWTTLLTAQNPNTSLKQTYIFYNTTAYRYYRLNFSSTWSNYNVICIYEIELSDFYINTAKEIIKSNLYPSTALKMYHQFEGNSTDTTTNDHDGTDTAITYGTDYGVFNQGALFNGSTSKIVLADHADLKPTGAYSYGCWIKTATYDNRWIFQSYKFDSGGNTAKGIYGFLDAGQSGKVGAAHSIGGSAPAITLYSASSVCDNNWHHFVVVFDLVKLYIYIDGNLSNSSAYTTGAVYDASNIVCIGCLSSVLYFFNGSIDDLFLLNGVALTAEQVYYLYNHRGANIYGVKASAQFLLDGNSKDMSLNAYNGVDTDMVYGVPYGRNNKQGASFNGTSSRFYISNNLYTSIDGQYTIAGWIKPIETREQTIFAYYTYFDASNQGGIKFRVTSGNKLYLFHRAISTASADVTGLTNIANNEWTFVVCRYNGSKLDLFRNGKLDGSANCNFAATFNGAWGAPFFGITRLEPTAPTWEYAFKGYMDKIAIIDYALTDSDIRHMYAIEKGLFE